MNRCLYVWKTLVETSLEGVWIEVVLRYLSMIFIIWPEMNSSL